MTDTLEYIERYFNGELSDPDKLAFEQRCEDDPAFARDVSFYIATRAALKDELHNKKKDEFKELYHQLSASRSLTATPLRRFLPYISLAAASLLMFIGWLIFLNDPSPRQLATNYIERNLHTLPVTMNAETDSLQHGFALFNQGDYERAEKVFQSLAQKEATAAEATRYLGITYLIVGQHNKALIQFETLSEYHDLYANHGPFYKAVTLMQRDAPGDREEAKEILEEVIEKQLPGSKEASDWISRL